MTHPRPDEDTRLRLARMGWPEPDHAAAARALHESPNGLASVAAFAAGQIHGEALVELARAAERHGREVAEQVWAWVKKIPLDAESILPAAEATIALGAAHAEKLIEAGVRGAALAHGARAVRMWPSLDEGMRMVAQMLAVCRRSGRALDGEDLVFAALTMRSVGPEWLARALSHRNARRHEIPVLALAHRSDALRGAREAGWPEEDAEEAGRALRGYPSVFGELTRIAAGRLHGPLIPAAALAIEKFGREVVEQILPAFAGGDLIPADLLSAAEAAAASGPQAARAAVALGFRRRDIVFVAQAIRLWPSTEEGAHAMAHLRALLQRAHVFPIEEDLFHLGPMWKNVSTVLGRLETPSIPKEAGTDPAPAAQATDTTRVELAADRPPADPEWIARAGQLGFPPQDQEAAARALAAHGDGVEQLAKFAAGRIRGDAIYHAAFAIEKFGRETVERLFERVDPSILDGPSIFAAAEAARMAGVDQAVAAIECGYRRRDIVHAAHALKLYPRIEDGVEVLRELQKLAKRLFVDIVDEDIRYAVLTWKNLGPEFLEKALRDRHPKNEKEPWARGVSIPIVAWAYRLSAPHAGAAIDECRERGVRRERLGHEVLAAFSRRFGREVPLPPWL